MRKILWVIKSKWMMLVALRQFIPARSCRSSLFAAFEEEKTAREARSSNFSRAVPRPRKKTKPAGNSRFGGPLRASRHLAALLTDPDLSHMARYALEPMPYPQAGEALLAALAKTNGSGQIGIINSLGFREEKESAADLIKLLKDPDGEIVGSLPWLLWAGSDP